MFNAYLTSMLNIVFFGSLTVVPKYNVQTGSYADIVLTSGASSYPPDMLLRHYTPHVKDCSGRVVYGRCIIRLILQALSALPDTSPRLINNLSTPE